MYTIIAQGRVLISYFDLRVPLVNKIPPDRQFNTFFRFQNLLGTRGTRSVQAPARVFKTVRDQSLKSEKNFSCSPFMCKIYYVYSHLKCAVKLPVCQKFSTNQLVLLQYFQQILYTIRAQGVAKLPEVKFEVRKDCCSTPFFLC